MTNIHISFILNRGSTVYIGIISGCFDGSATVQWVIKVLYEAGVGIKYSYIIIAILNVVIVCLTTKLHPVTKDYNKDCDIIQTINHIEVSAMHLSATNESGVKRQGDAQGISFPKGIV